MPRYDYKCDNCRTITEVIQSFVDDALTICAVCNGPISKYYGNINFAPSAMPTRNSDAATRNAHEKQLEKDLPAYARLRKEGMQPKSTVGAAELEARAESRFEVEYGTVADSYISKRADEAVSHLKTNGVI
jgi:putative FmdB family regulatory protein